MAGLGKSLRETCAWAEAGGIVSLSDPSLLERLCKAAPWLGDIVAALIAEQAKVPRDAGPGIRGSSIPMDWVVVAIGIEPVNPLF